MWAEWVPEHPESEYDAMKPKGNFKPIGKNVSGYVGHIPSLVKGEDPPAVLYELGSKPTNPKDAIGSDKLPLDLVPDTLEIYAALAFLEGALKYGKFNWRVSGVRMSIYMAAFKRHYKKFQNGEWEDKKTKVPHLASMLACIGIILDAKACGKLVDDRPPKAPVAELIDELEPIVPHLKELFKDKRPHQHTIMDEQENA